MKLKINGSKICIEGEFDINKVDKALTFKVPNYWFSPAYKRGKWDGSVHYLKNKTFPVGFLHRIQKLYPKIEIECNYPKPNIYSLSEYVKKAQVHKYPREYQYEAIKIGVTKKLGIIKLATNAGKGRVIAGIASAFPDINFLMLAHRKDIITEINNECHEFLTTNNYEISTFQSAKNYDLSQFGGVLIDECIYPGTYILLPDGSSKTIAKIYKDKEQYVLTVDKYNNLVNGKVLRWIKNKINNRKILRIKIKNNHGRYHTLCCTDNHGIYTLNGKVRADNLKIGDVVYYVYGNKNYSKFHKIKKDKKYDNLTYETAKIIKITENRVRTNYVYNLEIEKTNKYFASDILVSNCSSVAAQTFYNVVIGCYNANVRIGFSATPERSDGKDYMIEAAVGQPIIEIEQQELVKRGVSVKPKVYVVPFSVDTFSGGYTSVEDMLINSSSRNSIISKLAKGKKQVVILFKRLDHGKLIHSIIPGSVYVDGKTTQDKREKIKQDFIDGKIDCLISSNIFDTGVNLPNMTTLILAWAGKSPHGLIQKIGRAVRSCEGKTGVDIWCFGEMGNKYLDEHTKIRIGKLVDDGYDVEILKGE